MVVDYNRATQTCYLLTTTAFGGENDPNTDSAYKGSGVATTTTTTITTTTTPSTTTTTTPTTTTTAPTNSATCTPASYTEQYNYNYYGGSGNIVFGQTGVTSLQDCEALCNCYSSCQIAVQKTDSNICYLLSSAEYGSGSDTVTDSALKIQ